MKYKLGIVTQGKPNKASPMLLPKLLNAYSFLHSLNTDTATGARHATDYDHNGSPRWTAQRFRRRQRGRARRLRERQRVSEYIRDLIRRDKERKEQEAFDWLKAELAHAFAAPDTYISRPDRRGRDRAQPRADGCGVVAKVLVQEAASWRLDEIYRYPRDRRGAEQADRYIAGLFETFDGIDTHRTSSRPVPTEFGIEGYFFRYERHFVYWRRLSNGDIGIVTILARADAPDRLIP